MNDNLICPNCGTAGMQPFYAVENVPVHSVLLMHSREQALTYPTGKITLAACEHCGFISNVDFDASLHEYSLQYEATQAYSPTFNKFHRNLAQRLIDTYDLHNKEVIEIGCGMGEFLIMLCEMGPNRGVGFDPSYDPERIQSPVKERIEFVQDFYSEKYTSYDGDFIVCKMTLEHIPDTADFLQTVRRSIGDRFESIVFFQIPNGSYVMRDVAFWDVYYEHCSYFNLGSLSYLFETNGFEVLNLAAEYDDQYIMIEARPLPLDAQHSEPTAKTKALIADLKADVAYFKAQYPLRRQNWLAKLAEIKANGQKAVIWGGGSKGVAFLTGLGVGDEIGYAVDINPLKHGTFMAGTGHEIVGPEFLRSYQPDVVIVMNPIYCAEIQRDLDRLGVSAHMLTVDLQPAVLPV